MILRLNTLAGRALSLAKSTLRATNNTISMVVPPSEKKQGFFGKAWTYAGATLTAAFVAAVFGRIYTRRRHFDEEAENFAKVITCVPDIKSEITAASPDLEESNEETRMKIYNALLDPAKRKEVVISGKRGTGLVHGVSDVAHSLQADFNYKFLPIDLRNALGDVHTNTAMDLVKGLLPRGALMDILEPLSCLEEGMKKYQQATKRRLVLVVNNAQLILQLYNTEEREKLVVFLHHLATGNVADVVLVFGKQGFADEYMCLAGDLEMTNAKFIAPTNEKVKTYLTDEIADYMEENNLTFKGEYYNKLGSAYIECFGGGQLKVLKRAVKALKVRKVDGVGGFMDAVVEKKAQTNKELSDKIKQRKERMAARFEINRQITEWLKSEPWKSRVRLMLKGLDHDLRHSKIFRGQFF